MTKCDLRNGMFGKDNDGEIFVVVGDKLIYEGGKYSDFDDMNDNMEYDPKNHVCEVHEATCFKQVKDGYSKLIWKRPEPKVEESKSEECEEGKITVTEDEFLEAVKKGNEVWMEVAKKTPGDDIVNLVMGMQNMTFGSVIASILFGKEID